jgi:outer membrane lipase/esterase
MLAAFWSCSTIFTGTVAADEAVFPYFDRVIVFGDSISDSGTYADKAPEGAGKFTTNPDSVWVEVAAGHFGFELTSAFFGGTNYAEGGARVDTERPNAPGSLSRRPITTQVADFMENDGVLTAESLVIIQGGGNDVFATKLNGADDTPADLQVLETAANTLAGEIVRLAEAGAGTIVTTSVPKFEVYNDFYKEALAASGANVLFLDMYGLIAEIEENPGEFGITNTTDRACRGTALESFVCLPESYVTPDANRTYLYADSVHFTGVVHEIQGDLLFSVLDSSRQIGQLGYAFRSVMATGSELAQSRVRLSEFAEPGWSVIGRVAKGGAEIDASSMAAGLDSDHTLFQAGFEHAFSSSFVAGLYFSTGDMDGEFSVYGGNFKADVNAVEFYMAKRFSSARLSLTASHGWSDISHIERPVVLGPAVRTEYGETDGTQLALSGRFEYIVPMGDWQAMPFADLRYDHVSIDGYAEMEDRASALAFGDQTVKTLIGSVGLRFAAADAKASFQPSLEISYPDDLSNEKPDVTILPNGAPVAYTANSVVLNDEAIDIKVGLVHRFDERLSVGVDFRSRQAGSGGMDEMAGGIKLSLRF